MWEECLLQLRDIEGVQVAAAFSQNPFERTSPYSSILVRLPANQTPESREQVMAAIRKRVPPFHHMRCSVRRLFEPGAPAPLAYPLIFCVHGPSERPLHNWAHAISAWLGKDSKVTDLAWQPWILSPEEQTRIDQELAKMSVTLEDVEKAIRSAPPSLLLVDLGDGQWITLDSGHRFRDVEGPKIRNAKGELVPLLLSTLELHPRHPCFNSRPMIEFTANPAAGVSLESARRWCEEICEAARKELNLSKAYRVTWR